MAPPRVRPQPATPLGRILANTAWLLGGKGFGAICGIAYLAILTRGLGLKGFGHFSLLVGTAQALVAIAGFQTWRIVVRYGVDHVFEKRPERFGRLVMFCGMLDALGAAIGCGIAYVAFYRFGDELGVNPAYVHIGFLFCCAQLWALVSTPTGVVRALDRFDLSIYVEAVVPVGRLAAATAIWLTGPTVGKFLIAWAVVDMVEAALYWGLANSLAPASIRFAHLHGWRRTIPENPGIRRFLMVTYASATLDAATKQGPLLAVGGLVGTKAAGLYRLANQVTQSLTKLSSLLARSVYAEISRARVVTGATEFRQLAMKTSRLAALGGLVVVAVAVLLGGPLMGLLGGDDFRRGSTILIPLAIAASFDLASVAFEPVLHSTGRARESLAARLLAVAVLGIAMWLLIGHGAVGAAWAVTASGATAFLVMGLLARITLHAIEQQANGTVLLPMERPVRPPEMQDWLNLRLYHPLSWKLARLLAPTFVSPNMVSVTGAMFVIAAGLSYVGLIWPVGALVGLFLHMSWHVVDGADGDLARLTGKTSPRGEMVDGICDYASHIVLYLLLGWFLSRQIGVWTAWPITVLAGAGHAIQANHIEVQRRFYQRAVHGTTWLHSAPPPPKKAHGRRVFYILAKGYLRIAGGLTPATLMADHAVATASPAQRETAREFVRTRWRRLLRLEKILGPNPRALVLGASMLITRSPLAYFLIILIVASIMLIFSARWHQAAARDVIAAMAE